MADRYCTKCGNPIGRYGGPPICKECVEEVREARKDRKRHRAEEREAAEEAAWANARFHPIWFLFIGWWATILMVTATVAMSGLPLVLLIWSRGSRRLIFRLVGYY